MADSSGSARSARPGLVSGKALFAIAVWGTSFVATRVALEALTPFGLVALRMAVGAVTLGCLVRWRGRASNDRAPARRRSTQDNARLTPLRGAPGGSRRQGQEPAAGTSANRARSVRVGRLLPHGTDVPRCVFIGCVVGVHVLIQAYGLLYTSAINTGWIIAFMPVTIALGAQLFLKQRLMWIGWGGAAVASGGVFVVTLSSPAELTHAGFGDLLQLCSCVTWTIYTLVGAGLVARNGALRVTALAMAVAAGMLIVVTLWTGALRGPVTGRALWATAYLVFLCSGLPYYLWFAAQHEYGPTRVGALLYFEPFFTLASAAVVIHEPITLGTLVGGFAVLAGVWLVGKGARR